MKTLIVDDSGLNRLLLSETISPFGPCHKAVNGREAVLLFKQAWEEKEPYDLICLDIIMPEMDGHEALQEIRQWEEERHISRKAGVKVIMVTSLDDSRNMLESFKKYCDDYITKPVEGKKLIFKILNMGLIK